MKKLVVIDNFYESPGAVRDFALTKAEYFAADQLSEGYAGTESKRSYYSCKVVEKIEKAIGQKIVVDETHFSFAVFCKSFQKDERNRSVHLDPSDWTGLVYLNKQEDCRGGTAFYRHIETGLELVPSDAKLTELGYSSRGDFMKRLVYPQSKDFTKWEQTGRIGMKYNRMLLFRASEMFHSATGYFGASNDDCRLTQLFFFKTDGVQK